MHVHIHVHIYTLFITYQEIPQSSLFMWASQEGGGSLSGPRQKVESTQGKALINSKAVSKWAMKLGRQASKEIPQCVAACEYKPGLGRTWLELTRMTIRPTCRSNLLIGWFLDVKRPSYLMVLPFFSYKRVGLNPNPVDLWSWNKLSLFPYWH